MDKWFKDILPDKDPYHNRGRDQMRKKGGPEFECLWPMHVQKRCTLYMMFCYSHCNTDELHSNILKYLKRTDYWVWCLTPLSKNFSGGQFYWRKTECTEKTTDLPQVTDIQKSWVFCSFAYPRWRFLQARNFYKDFLKKYFVRGCGHFSEVKYLTLHR